MNAKFNKDTALPAVVGGVPPMDMPVKITELGLSFDPEKPLTIEQWYGLGQQISRLERCAGFLIGDWVNYGETRKEYGEKYTEAMKATGLDYQTLKNYAHVASRIQLGLRNPNLSFNHHRKVAKLKDAEQSKWLNVASKAKEEGKPISVRQLGTFIIAGKVLSSKHADNKAKEKGVLLPIPVVGRLCAWWKNAKAPGSFDRMTSEQKQTVGREIYPVVEIYREIQRSAAMPDPVTSEIDPKPIVAALMEWWKTASATGRIQQFSVERQREIKRDLSFICRQLS